MVTRSSVYMYKVSVVTHYMRKGYSFLVCATLFMRKKREDLIEVLKITKSYERVDDRVWINMSNIPFTRGHTFKLGLQYCKLNV